MTSFNNQLFSKILVPIDGLEYPFRIDEVFTNIILTEISVYYGEITKYVEKVKNLIVIVSIVRSGSKNLLFGITPSVVIRYANCPVLIKN